MNLCGYRHPDETHTLQNLPRGDFWPRGDWWEVQGMGAAVTCQALMLKETDDQIARATLSSLGKDGPCPVMQTKETHKE